MNQKPKLLTVLDWITGILFSGAVIAIFLYAPMEAVMGWVQKVFYFHVASGWTGMLGFLLAATAGIFYLLKKDPVWDRVGYAAVEIGMVFMSICIISGSIWARPIWNTWWTWEPRLTTAAIMVLIYAAYLLLRQGLEEPERRARFGAVYAVVGFISVPMTFLSIRRFRTIHPVVIGGNQPCVSGAFDMTSKMVQVLILWLLAFSFIFADILWHRIRLGELADEVEQKKIFLQSPER